MALTLKSIGGTLTPTGTVSTVATFVAALSGALGLSGTLSASNPDWLLIDDALTWMGEWDATYPYDLDDVVLYKATGDPEWHVFISKATHNTGNNPDSSATWWRRLYQEQFHGNR